MSLKLAPRLCTRQGHHALNFPSSSSWLAGALLARSTRSRPVSISSARRNSSARSSFGALPSSLSTPQDMTHAREWIARFSSAPLSAFPKDSLLISFSRSSGPGGQNVNKLSTKAHLRLCLSPPPSWLPPYLLPSLLDSPSYVSTSPSGLLLSSSNTRSQAQNVELGIKRIKDLILEAARVGLKGDTSQEQQERVKALERRERSKLLKQKKQRKELKAGRRTTPKLGFE